MKQDTQRGETAIVECACGCHMIRLVKDIDLPVESRRHSIEFWEYRGDTRYTYWDRLKLAFAVLFKKDFSRCTYEVIINNNQVVKMIEELQYMKQE